MNTDTTMNAMPADRESLYLMTKLKLDRFQQRKIRFDEEYSKIMQQVNDEKTTLMDKVNILHEGVQELFENEGQERYLTNFDKILTIANASTSTSNSLLESFCQRLGKVIEGGKNRSEYNYLFGLIMSQWFSRQEKAVTPVKDELTTETPNYILTNERLETIIFDQPQLDLDNWRKFLDKLFSHFNEHPKLKNTFETFKDATRHYGDSLLREKVSSDDVKRAMRSLIGNGSLNDQRKRLLEKMLMDENAVEEFASSLTLLKSDLAEWNWSNEGVRGVFRRNLAGKYRCFYEEDFLTAIFLEDLGLKWTYHFKRQLQRWFNLLTENLVENNCLPGSIQHERIQMQQKDFWMASLPDETNEQVPYYETNNTSGVNLKSKLLYLINTEIQLHQTLRPDTPFSVVSADLEWFGPSIPHEIVRVFLDVCGMPKVWLDFFDRFLKQPVFYKPNEPIRQRRRGVPISHSLSYLFSELLLFGMDLHVYQSTGIFNYRMHDDFWFFDSQVSKIEQAWALMNEYATMTGLKFNSEKCGSVQVQPLNKMDTSEEEFTHVLLPQNDVKWGLLILQSTGRFVIDQNAIKKFLDEMKTRLTNATAILEWVNLYNEYTAFFMRNFGQSANILSTFHTTQMIEAFQSMHRYVFDQTNGNALTIIIDRIQQQFPACVTSEILEAWLYWPLTKGGLGLKNIYLDLYSVHNQLKSAYVTKFADLPEKDAEIYADLKEKYDEFKKHWSSKFRLDSAYNFVEKYVEYNEKLMTYDEFISWRETRLRHWTDVYKKMLKVTEPSLPTMTPTLERQMDIFQPNERTRSRRHTRQTSGKSENYLKWLLCYYAEQIESTFQQLDFIDSDSIPIGLIKIMKTSPINWEKDAN